LNDLVFGDERGPDDHLALQFKAVSQFTEHEKQTVRELLEGMILKHEARRWDAARTAAAKARPAAIAKRQVPEKER
jgi:TorA maturation chaperone TorD